MISTVMVSTRHQKKVEAVFQSAPPMQYSWCKVVPGASQLLQQIPAQPVNSGTPFKPVVREQPSIEMDGTMRNNILSPFTPIISR